MGKAPLALTAQLLRFDPVPIAYNVFAGPYFYIAEYMRMPPLKLTDKPINYVFNRKFIISRGDLGMKHYLK
jgi:hypothetical protein